MRRYGHGRGFKNVPPPSEEQRVKTGDDCYTHLSDDDLLEHTRRHDADAFTELWRRHSSAARAIAYAVSNRRGVDADDLVAEAFASIWAALQRNKGPREAFRPYLRVTIRHIAARSDRRLHERAIRDGEDFIDESTSEAAADRRVDRTTVARAFQSLPEKWQQVLWLSEVESLAPREIAGRLDIKPNAVSALAYRAREGLKQAWIRAHLQALPEDSECRWAIERFASVERHKASKADAARVAAHIAECPTCAVLAAEAHHAGSRLALGILVLVTGGWRTISSTLTNLGSSLATPLTRAAAAAFIIVTAAGATAAVPHTRHPVPTDAVQRGIISAEPTSQSTASRPAKPVSSPGLPNPSPTGPSTTLPTSGKPGLNGTGGMTGVLIPAIPTTASGAGTGLPTPPADTSGPKNDPSAGTGQSASGSTPADTPTQASPGLAVAARLPSNLADVGVGVSGTGITAKITGLGGSIGTDVQASGSGISAKVNVGTDSNGVTAGVNVGKSGVAVGTQAGLGGKPVSANIGVGDHGVTAKVKTPITPPISISVNIGGLVGSLLGIGH